MFRKHLLKLGWSNSEKIEIFQNDSLHNNSIFTTWMWEVKVGINSEDVNSALIFVRDKYVSIQNDLFCIILFRMTNWQSFLKLKCKQFLQRMECVFFSDFEKAQHIYC